MIRRCVIAVLLALLSAAPGVRGQDAGTSRVPSGRGTSAGISRPAGERGRQPAVKYVDMPAILGSQPKGLNGQTVRASQKEEETDADAQEEDEYEKITMDQITSWAVARHPALTQATQLAMAYDGDVIQAGLQNNPTIGYYSDDVGVCGEAGLHGVAVSQEFIRGQKRAARRSSAQAARDAAGWSVEIRKKKIENDAYLAGYRLLIAQKKEAVAQKLLEICQHSADISVELYEAGEISASDALQEKVELSEAQMRLNDIRVEHAAASQAVSVILNVPDTSFYVTDAIAIQSLDIDEEDLFREVMENSPELKKASADLAAAQAAVRRQCAETLVDVTVSGNVFHSYLEKSPGGGVAVSVPVRVHNRNQGNILRAQREVQAAEANLERVRQALTIRFREEMAKLHAAWQRVELYQEGVLDDVDESVRLAQEAYRSGACSSLELLSAEQTMYGVYVSYLDSVRTFLETRAVLQGFMLRGGYDEP